MPRYRFGEFTVSPARRSLERAGRDVPLIPRYFDLLVLLVERRGETLGRDEILDIVWSDVIVSDGALSQAIRVVRRALGDDPREPTHVRTYSRRGYRFIRDDVVEEPDEPDIPDGAPPASAGAGPGTDAPHTTKTSTDSRQADPFSDALEALLRAPRDGDAADGPEDDARREVAATLHALGTERALRALDERRGDPAHDLARAYLRDARWDMAGAGDVPLLGTPGGVRALRLLVALRVRRAWRLARARWSRACAGGAAAGLLAGFAGGLALRFGPGSTAANGILLALPLIGTVIGGLGAAGVGAGLALAEASIRSLRRTALVLSGALGGGAVGLAAHGAGLAVLEGLFGRELSPFAGGFEGVVLGGAVGLGYALATPTRDGGMATPRGAARARAVLAAGLSGALAAAALGASGHHLGAMSLDLMAQSFPGSQVGLEPLARLLGETHPGRVTRTAISAFEGLMFGCGVSFGLTRRPR